MLLNNNLFNLLHIKAVGTQQVICKERPKLMANRLSLFWALRIL